MSMIDEVLSITNNIDLDEMEKTFGKEKSTEFLVNLLLGFYAIGNMTEAEFKQFTDSSLFIMFK
jgi:hypothetical protein